MFRFLVAVLCFVFVAPSGFAEDWPHWRGVNRDGQATNFDTPDAWPSELTHVWSVAGGKGDSSPVLVDGKLYVFIRVGDQEILRCLDASDGTQLWEDSYDSITIKGAASSHSGPRSTPAVSDGKVVVIGIASIVSCYDAANGKLLWRKEPLPGQHPSYFNSASPLIVDGVCIAQLGGKESGAMIAFDLEDGAEKWRWEGDPPAYASPGLMTVDGETHIVALTGNNLVGVSVADGTLLWETPFPVARMSTNSATPLVAGDQVFISSTKGGTKAVRIVKDGGQFLANEVWSNAEIGTKFNSPILKDGLLVGLSDRKTLFALDAATGTLAWTDDERFDSFGNIVWAGSILFVLPGKGDLGIGRLSASGFEGILRQSVAKSATYGGPVVVGNRIFVQSQDSISAWSIH